MSGKQLTDLGRLGAPLYKAPGEDRYRVLSYSQALNKISKAMKEASPERTFFMGRGALQMKLRSSCNFSQGSTAQTM